MPVDPTVTKMRTSFLCVPLPWEKRTMYLRFGDFLIMLYNAVYQPPSAYYINSLLNRNGGSLMWVAVSLLMM